MHLVEEKPAAAVDATSGGAGAVVEALAGPSAAKASTLPTFSLQDRVVAITGGASGLGLVMGKGAVDSGAHLAIVDINSSFEPPPHFRQAPCEIGGPCADTTSTEKAAELEVDVLLMAYKEQHPDR